MTALRFALFSFLACLCSPSWAELSADSLPANTKWYLHADLEALRSAASGKPLYDWLDGEVFVEIHEEVGIDLGKEANAVTAFADAELGTIIIVDGPIAQETREKLLALAAADASLDMLKHDGKTYYHVSETGAPRTGHGSLDDLQESAYFTFDLKDKVVVASAESQIKAMLESGGRLPGNPGHRGALFVLTADRSFVQAGVRTGEIDDDDDWDSNILRNTEQFSILVSGQQDLLAVEAQLVSREPDMARSLGDIANGLLSLQTLNSDLDPELRELLRSTRVKVDDKVLSVNLVLDANRIVAMLEDH
jgi:hypothetical protein